VWLGVHEVIDSKVAIKVLHQQSCVDPDLVQRFVVEAKAVNRIDSPYIVKVFDFGRLPDGRDYAVMEYLEGETLREHLLREQTLRWPAAREIALRVSSALEAAHDRGVVHRDLKPDNVFLCRRSRSKRLAVKVLDFGIAKLTGETGVATRVGSLLGTPTYAAPEQLAGEPTGAAADVYSLGVLLYEMLSGSVPFRTREAMQKLIEAAAPLPDTVTGLPKGVRPLIAAMLARDPDARPSISEVITAIHDAGTRGSAISVERQAKSFGRQIALVAALGLLAGVAIGLPVVWGDGSLALSKVWIRAELPPLTGGDSGTSRGGGADGGVRPDGG
jgi:serine/threonine-protein kinase